MGNRKNPISRVVTFYYLKCPLFNKYYKSYKEKREYAQEGELN